MSTISNSEGCSFNETRIITFESGFNRYSWLFRYSQSSNCRFTEFVPQCNEIHSDKYFEFDSSNLDVHNLLSRLVATEVYHVDFIQSIESLVTSIALPNWICNDEDYKNFDISRFTLLESLDIGNDSFSYVQTFKIDGLRKLKCLQIGQNSFTQVKGGPWHSYNYKSKSFHILNCESLESIQIGEYSFSDFAGDFELKNCPQLQSIQIGKIGSDSYNFCNSSFVIRGTTIIFNVWMHRSSKSTIHYIRWPGVPLSLIDNNWRYCMKKNEMIEWLDLPSLQSIQLGEYALFGSKSTSFIMRSRMKNWMIRSSKSDVHWFNMGFSLYNGWSNTWK